MTSWRTAGTPTLRCYHHGKIYIGIYIGDSFALGCDGRFFLAERDRCVEWDDPQPLAEKDEACALADRAAEAPEQLKGAFKPADAEDLSGRVRILRLTCRSYRALVARGRQICQPSPADLAALHSAIDELESAGEAASKAFAELGEPEPSGDTPRRRQPGILVRDFARAFRADVPNLPRREIVMSLTALRRSASLAWRSSRRAVRGCWRSRANDPSGGLMDILLPVDTCVAGQWSWPTGRG